METKSTGTKPEEDNHRAIRYYYLHKGAVLQLIVPGRTSNGADVAKRYCRRDPIGDRLRVIPGRGWRGGLAPFDPHRPS